MPKLFITLLLLGLLTSDVFGARMTVQNGNKVKSTNDFPFIVLLTGTMSICTGSLVTPSSVLSAGLCACIPVPLTDVYVDTLSMTSLGSRGMISKKIVHPKFGRVCRSIKAGIVGTEGVNDHNLAIFKLSQPFTHKHKASIAVFDFYNHIRLGSDVMVAGYGMDTSAVAGLMAGVLKYGKMTTVGCAHPSEYENICVRGSSRQNASPGDNGGPLMTLDKKIVGTVSMMMTNEHGYTELIYIQIRPYRDFILSNS